jgi:hypothetical protein
MPHEPVSVRGELVTYDTRYRLGEEEMVGRGTLRFMLRAKIADRLHAAGFAEVERYGWWDGAAFDADTSPEIIVIARRRAAF